MPDPAPRRLDWIDLPLDAPVVPSGKLALHRSLTSGLCRRAGDPPDVFWGVGDRGPNIKPRDAATRYGLAQLAPLAAIDGAKILVAPAIGPALARFRLEGDRVVSEAVFPLRAPDGTAITGLPAPEIDGAETEAVFALDGAPLPPGAQGADTEGIAPGPDGRFWIAEEYGPSLLLVDERGMVHERHVPLGSEARFAGSAVPVHGGLPPIALKRRLNRGFEALADDPQRGIVYAAFQSPLAHPGKAAHDAGDLVRIWALDRTDLSFIAQYAYPLDPPTGFARDSAAGPVMAGDVKVSEIAVLPGGDLLVLERVTLSTHFYRVTPDAAVPGRFLDPTQRPTLEQLGQAGCTDEGIPLLAKQRVFSSDDHPEICADLEGLLVLDGGGLLLANDSDYGTEGARTEFWRVWPAEA